MNGPRGSHVDRQFATLAICDLNVPPAPRCFAARGVKQVN